MQRLLQKKIESNSLAFVIMVLPAQQQRKKTEREQEPAHLGDSISVRNQISKNTGTVVNKMSEIQLTDSRLLVRGRGASFSPFSPRPLILQFFPLLSSIHIFICIETPTCIETCNSVCSGGAFTLCSYAGERWRI